MKLLAHRGIWTDATEKNTFGALTAACTDGIGIETDVRDCDGQLVISHDMPRADALRLDTLLQAIAPRHGTLALNIKADGLQQPLQQALRKHGIGNYFVFDMSVPDTLGYRRADMPFAARISDYERDNALLDSAQFVWLDAFESEWYSIDLVHQLLACGKHVAIVSPELHRRDPAPLWSQLCRLKGRPGLYLCTDFITDALETFDVERD
jgi:glycerophosphoryl diester phosphodiesterase